MRPAMKSIITERRLQSDERTANQREFTDFSKENRCKYKKN